MLTTAFDTYAAAKRLQNAGFDEAQVEATVSIVRDAASADRDDLATKADIEGLKGDFNAKLANLETRLTLRMVALSISGVGIIVAAVKLIPGSGAG